MLNNMDNNERVWCAPRTMPKEEILVSLNVEEDDEEERTRFCNEDKEAFGNWGQLVSWMKA